MWFVYSSLVPDVQLEMLLILSPVVRIVISLRLRGI